MGESVVLQLSGNLLAATGFDASDVRPMFVVTKNAQLPVVAASKMGLLARHETPAGFGFYVRFESDVSPSVASRGVREVVLPGSAQFLDDGDVIRLNLVDGSYRVMFRRKSENVAILLTERCNHYCLMCSQPPRDVDDVWVARDVDRLLHLIPPSAPSICFTGGEPTLLGGELIRLMRIAKTQLPRTSLHILSNGRSFADAAFASKYADVDHHDLMVGIPLYSDDPVRHDYVVQARGAFDETIRGILNLKRLGQRVEIRVVLHRQTIDTLHSLVEFISRNLLFVDQVALMGLEVTGFTKGNLPKLWIDPYEYRDVLASAVTTLAAYRIPVRVFNHQLCVVTEAVRPFCVRSISDWKNDYLPICDSCELRPNCGGFFSSTIREHHSNFIRPFSTR